MTNRQSYEADGYFLQTTSVLPSDLIARAIAGQDSICRGEYDTGTPPEGSFWNPGDPADKFVKIEQPQRASQAIWEVISHSGIGKLAAEVTGAQMVQVWWVQMLVKPATTPGQSADTNVGWHQDRQYWQSWEEGSELFTAWVALSDVQNDCGPMTFLRGSHQWGLLEQQGNFYGQDLDALKAGITEHTQQATEEVPAILSPGCLSLHHCLTFHGSGPNTSGIPRRSFAVHMRTEKSRPIEDRREGLTRFIDDETICPVIWQS